MPVILQLNNTQTMELIKNGDLRVELTDDQAIDVTAQIGQLLKSKEHYTGGSHTSVYKVRNPRVPYKSRSKTLRRITHVKGGQTVSSRVYAKIEEMTPGTKIEYQEILKLVGIDRTHDSSVYMALARLVKARKVLRVGKGQYQVV